MAQTKDDPIYGSLGLYPNPDLSEFMTEEEKLEARLSNMKPRVETNDEEHDDTQDSIAWAEGWTGGSYTLPTEEEQALTPPPAA